MTYFYWLAVLPAGVCGWIEFVAEFICRHNVVNSQCVKKYFLGEFRMCSDSFHACELVSDHSNVPKEYNTHDH